MGARYSARGARMRPGNRYAYKIFIDNGFINSERGREIFSLSMGQKIIEKHWAKAR